MLKAARAQGMPMMVIAMTTAATPQPIAIHTPPSTSHNRFSSSAIGVIGYRPVAHGMIGTVEMAFCGEPSIRRQPLAPKANPRPQRCA